MTKEIRFLELKEQKNWLLERIDRAIEKAPEKSKEKIVFRYSDRGRYSVYDAKESLKKFREIVKKEFPDKPLKFGEYKPAFKPGGVSLGKALKVGLVEFVPVVKKEVKADE